ncbi:MAG: Holliday junction resolvase RuvX [Candidatus Nanopelagicales bacterium]|nr:Holliday junction resolvase RuvX [Candidatus Nanopelagicales bacterium]
MACDVGTVRIGLARSDAHGILAFPLDAVAAGEGALAQVSAIVAELEAVEVVIGLPYRLDGSEGPAAQMARDWAELLAEHVQVPIALVDERLTTVQAQRGMHAAGRTVRNSRKDIDSASAVVLLQSVLDRPSAAGS